MRKKPKFKSKKIKNKIVKHKFYLSDFDRETYCYEIDKNGVIQKVIDVSYEVNINDQWITIVRYDSQHGFLHRHMRISVENSSDTPTTFGVIKRGKPQNWLTWARKDITKNFIAYRTRFFKRSKIKNLY